MQLSFRQKGARLVATLDCSVPGKLKSGGLGWFDRGSTDWRFDWKLRVQCSITKTGPAYGYGQPHVVKGLGAPTKRPSWRRTATTSSSVSHRPGTLRVEFLLPDCIDLVGHALDPGCCAGGPVSIGGCRYHCSALLKAVPPSFEARLERIAGGIRLLQSVQGRTIMVGEMQDNIRGRPLFNRLLEGS